MSRPLLLAVPNVSEGRDARAIEAIGRAFTHDGPGTGRVRLLDVHSDADHHRSVFTLAGEPGALSQALIAGARAAVQRLDIVSPDVATGPEDRQHPFVGAVDVVPIVYLEESSRGAACAEALVVADRIGHELSVPVFLYGELTSPSGEPQRTRAELRRGGVAALARRMSLAGQGALAPDFGPAAIHPRAGATLVSARPALVAFNVQLAPPAGLEEARAVAAIIREGGADGLAGVRAIGVRLGGGVAQVSTNVELPWQTRLADVVEAVARHAPVASAELVGLAPRAALDGFPKDVRMPGFDPERHVLENALGF